VTGRQANWLTIRTQHAHYCCFYLQDVNDPKVQHHILLLLLVSSCAVGCQLTGWALQRRDSINSRVAALLLFHPVPYTLLLLGQTQRKALSTAAQLALKTHVAKQRMVRREAT
jgi:hypothetical protein